MMEKRIGIIGEAGSGMNLAKLMAEMGGELREAMDSVVGTPNTDAGRELIKEKIAAEMRRWAEEQLVFGQNTVMVVRHIVPGARRIRSKKKRHQEKWLKKNTMRITDYQGITIVDYSENFPPESRAISVKLPFSYNVDVPIATEEDEKKWT